MKVGFLVECGLKGADEQVLRFLVNTLRKDIEPRFATCGSKRVILDECGQHVELLFTVERCETVFRGVGSVPLQPGAPDQRKAELHQRAKAPPGQAACGG